MEKVSVIAVKSFINAITGTVTKKQKLSLPKNLAKEFVAMGLVVYAEKKLETPAVETTPDSETTDGTVTPSVSLPAETVSATTTLATPKRGRGRRAGR